ncbi:TlpA disulfide reductase family protein [uncultured Paludibaculum sp.]|uniref:TlpA family protein disulfide reductase n=1 Tax=uncultured Paludibaculum sp. TaxID=1765020 RepID=UPI002AAC2F42|nr:TlpA disulfide reductase family protein [uncultured Paludibaculum sp.]
MKQLLLFFVLTLSAFAGPLSGKRVASFTLADATGKYYDVLDFRGKVLLIDIMKTNCPHCQALSRTLEQVKAKYGDKLAVLSIVNPPDDPKTVSAYIATYKVTNPVLFDFGQATAAMLRITPQNPSISLPTLLIVDAQGIVRSDLVYSDSQSGSFAANGLTSLIDKALGAAAAAPKKK